VKKILVRGPLLSKSGYGTHARQIVSWLIERGIEFAAEITPWGITPWHLNASDLNGLIGKIMEASGKKSDRYDASIQIQLPHEWEQIQGCYNIGVTAGTETDFASKDWAIAVSKMDLVIVPSSFTKESLVRGQAPSDKIVVIPECFNPEILSVTSGLPLKEVESNFNFLLFGQITGNDPDRDRKNIFYTVKWFCEEFAGNKDVGLVIKSNMGTNCVFHRKALNDLFKKLISEVRKGEYPRVYLLNGDMSEADCAALYKSPKVHCMVSFTKGEGYGLPLVDAAASGLPVIATDWSGHLDFLNRGKFSKVSYSMVNVPQSIIDEKIFASGSKWAMPKEEDAKKRMKKMVESRHTPKQWADELSQKVLSEFSQEAVNLRYDDVLGKLLC
jgi:glycosyltransferase involved in cell wall biosynthesis